MSKDAYGPLLILDVHRADIGLEGYLVIDNTALGSGKGGVRMHTDVTCGEVTELARTMSLKNALAELPFGGAKAGIVWTHAANKQELFSAFFEEIKYLMPERYISAPDIGTGEEAMGWLLDITGDGATTTGKPTERGGMQHKSASTGYGVAIAAQVAAKHRGVSLQDATLAVDGYGTVGSWAARFLSQEAGMRLVATSNRHGAIHKPDGLELDQLDEIQASGGKVTTYPGCELMTHDEMLALDVDVLITASVSDIIHDRNHHDVTASLIIEGSNLPMSHEIETIFYERGICVVPDIVANAGGVIASYVEYENKDLSRDYTFNMIGEKITRMTERILEASQERREYPRACAIELAYERLNKEEDRT